LTSLVIVGVGLAHTSRMDMECSDLMGAVTLPTGLLGFLNTARFLLA
jgi:hypothetical protein